MINISNLWVSYSTKDILKGINLSVQKSEKITIIGESGCGKSTLLRTIMGLQPISRGKVLIKNKDISNIEKRELNKLRLKCGFLFQGAALFDSLTIEENVGFVLRQQKIMNELEIRQKVKKCLKLVDMLGSQRKYPSELSGGQKKRIGLARVLAYDPEILLYDEPTTGLDPILSTNIEDLINHLSNTLKVTSIVVTHQQSTIQRTGDKIYFLKDGKLCDPETPQSIMNSKNLEIQRFIKGIPSNE